MPKVFTTEDILKIFRVKSVKDISDKDLTYFLCGIRDRVRLEFNREEAINSSYLCFKEFIDEAAKRGLNLNSVKININKH